jgi:glutathionylspermidine synthase
MRRHTMPERANWRETADATGFHWHSAGGVRYWDESGAFSFTLKQIEDDLEAPSAELEGLCFAFIEKAIESEEILTRLAIPRPFWELIWNSWKRGDRNLYGRFDFAYDGSGPAKLLEYNADTPTSLFEAAVFQWMWLEQQLAAGVLPAGADQFNSLHEKLVEAFGGVTKGARVPFHFAHAAGSAEDEGTVSYLADLAGQAGHRPIMLTMDQIGLMSDGRFADQDERPMQWLFKLYPWEWLMREEFGQAIPNSRCHFVEPAWKALLANKGLLAELWAMAPGHPNLLPCFHDGDPRVAELGADVVVKPLYSREGANVTVLGAAGVAASTEGPYGEEGAVRQARARLFNSAHGHAVVGSWMVASQPAGIGIREDATLVTRDTARFVPHFIEP